MYMFEGNDVDWTGEGVYAGIREPNGTIVYREVTTFDEISYQMRLGHDIRWLEEEDLVDGNIENYDDGYGDVTA